MKPIDGGKGSKSNITIEDEQKHIKLKESQYELLERTALECLQNENIGDACDISIILVDDEKIRKLNSEFRNIDAATDVLSFPMLEMLEGDVLYEESDLDMDTGLLLLGDIVMSLETAERQALEYGHSFDRELAFLISHGVFHLLGYDHVEETGASKMFEKQEKVLLKMGLQRK
jgi:probable rRNA maturation factor